PGSSEAGSRTGYFERVLVDRSGHRYEWSFDPRIGFGGSVVVGFASSILGIGGGIIHVPLLATVLGFPAHVATATSHAVLAVTAGIATVVHIVHGDYRAIWPLVVATAGGAVAGAPIGARLSTFVPGAVILRVLATALAFVGLRLILTALLSRG
ncbi:MAG TPA: TSUP family transporter, partial [Candidatus Lustribacter sp.]